MGLKVPHRDMLVDSELLELDKQAKFGDPVSGWRGDETMFVCVQPVPAGGAPMIQVWGLDAHGREYLACSTPAGVGYRHVLLGKLVKGDWQHRAGSLVDETMAANQKIRDDADKRWDDWMENEFGPKLHHAFVKDGAAPREDFYMTPRGRKGQDS